MSLDFSPRPLLRFGTTVPITSQQAKTAENSGEPEAEVKSDMSDTFEKDTLDKSDSEKPELSSKDTKAKSQDAFAPFVRVAAPNPIPSKWSFYVSEFKANMRNTMQEGNQQYHEALMKDEHTQLKATSMALATGLGLTVFRRLRRTATFLLLMAVLGKPIVVATKTFPQISQAYDEVKQGNPTKGKAKFRDALDQSFYSIFKDFFKPISFGLMLAYALEVPFVLRGEGAGVRHKIIRQVAGWLRIKGHFKPIAKLQQRMQPAVYWGDRQANGIRAKVPIIDWIEDPVKVPGARNFVRMMKP